MKAKIIYEGVTFVVAACASMSKDEFVRLHVDAFWLDKDVKTRRKMLAEVYNLIVPPAASEKKD